MPAIVEASARRLRPILMTTLATILGALPLTIAAGTGATGRQQIGHVVIAGMIFSTLFTLFIVPVLYCHLSWRPGRYGITGGNSHDESHPEPAIAVPAGERF
jgi:multidrug efflux pump